MWKNVATNSSIIQFTNGVPLNNWNPPPPFSHNVKPSSGMVHIFETPDIAWNPFMHTLTTRGSRQALKKDNVFKNGKSNQIIT